MIINLLEVNEMHKGIIKSWVNFAQMIHEAIYGKG